MSAWIQTYTGIKFQPFNPTPSTIAIVDIAHSLAMQCRFNGHTNHFYSVAEHCCHVADYLPLSLRLPGLLHDASEAYLCDLPRPLKHDAQGFGDNYRAAEDRLMSVIAERFSLTYPFHEDVKHTDNRMLATEALQLMSPLHPDWPDRSEPIPELKLYCWSPMEAREQFLRRFHSLCPPMLWFLQ